VNGVPQAYEKSPKLVITDDSTGGTGGTGATGATGTTGTTGTTGSTAPTSGGAGAGAGAAADSKERFGDIVILFQHELKPRPDDVLTISVDPDSPNFFVTLDQKFIGSKSTMSLCAEDLYNYLRMYFKATMYDAEGYSYVQFHVPMFPSVLTKISSAKQYLETNLIPQIDALLPSWPTETVTGTY
jgi:hypothetical protein